MTKREVWELIKTHMPELAKEILANPGLFKQVSIKIK